MCKGIVIQQAFMVDSSCLQVRTCAAGQGQQKRTRGAPRLVKKQTPKQISEKDVGQLQCRDQHQRPWRPKKAQLTQPYRGKEGRGGGFSGGVGSGSSPEVGQRKY